MPVLIPMALESCRSHHPWFSSPSPLQPVVGCRHAFDQTSSTAARNNSAFTGTAFEVLQLHFGGIAHNANDQLHQLLIHGCGVEATIRVLIATSRSSSWFTSTNISTIDLPSLESSSRTSRSPARIHQGTRQLVSVSIGAGARDLVAIRRSQPTAFRALI